MHHVFTRVHNPGQVDWEAILAQHPDQFAASVSNWLLPPAARSDTSGTSAPASPTWPDVGSLAAVRDVLGTTRARLHALNPPGLNLVGQ
jgi:hypothetical protein